MVFIINARFRGVAITKVLSLIKEGSKEQLDFNGEYLIEVIYRNGVFEPTGRGIKGLDETLTEDEIKKDLFIDITYRESIKFFTKPPYYTSTITQRKILFIKEPLSDYETLYI
jgi:hypothetical protein